MKFIKWFRNVGNYSSCCEAPLIMRGRKWCCSECLETLDPDE